MLVCVGLPTPQDRKAWASRVKQGPLWGSTVRVTAAIIWPVDWPDLRIDRVMSPYNGWGYCSVRWMALNELADLNSFRCSHSGTNATHPCESDACWEEQTADLNLIGSMSDIKSLPQQRPGLWSLAEKTTENEMCYVCIENIGEANTDDMAKPSRSNINGVYSHFSPCDHWVCPCIYESVLLKLLYHLLSFLFSLSFVSPA